MGMLADGGAVSAHMLLRQVYVQVIVVPEGLAEELHLVGFHLKFHCGSKAQVTVLQVLNHLVPAMQLGAAGVKNNLTVKALFKAAGIAGAEGRTTVGHALFHLLVLAANVHRPGIQKSYVAAQINGKAELLDEICAQNSFQRMTAGFADTLQIYGGKAD